MTKCSEFDSVMKTKQRNCRRNCSLRLTSSLQFGLVVSWLVFAQGAAWSQNLPAPSNAGGVEAAYQAALQNGMEAQKQNFPTTALKYYLDALKLKPGDPTATKLRDEMQAEIRREMSLPPLTPPPATAPTAPPTAPPAAPPAVATQAQPPATTPPTPEAAAPAAPAPGPPKVRVTKNEVSASGDFFLGSGTVTMPFGFSLSQVSPVNITESVAKPNRTSDYYGGTLSYSYGQAWYVDLAYAHGTSSGNADVVLGSPPTLSSAFSITDDWYQAYLRYTFPSLRGKRLSAYLRLGATYVTADLTDETTIPALGLYRQTDKTTDIMGNLGAGVGYSLYTGRRFRVGLQLEGEGFYGRRSQESTEQLLLAGFAFPSASINNDLYGGIGRGTVRCEYRLGRSGLFKLFLDGGFQAKFTWITYSGLGTFDELLWGPYVKLGARYAF